MHRILSIRWYPVPHLQELVKPGPGTAHKLSWEIELKALKLAEPSFPAWTMFPGPPSAFRSLMLPT